MPPVEDIRIRITDDSSAVDTTINKLKELGKVDEQTADKFEKLGNAAKESAQKAGMSWSEFTKGKMGPYMKELGSHAAAIKKIAEEWKEYKKTGASALSIISAGISAINPKYSDQLNLINKLKISIALLKNQYQSAQKSEMIVSVNKALAQQHVLLSNAEEKLKTINKTQIQIISPAQIGLIENLRQRINNLTAARDKSFDSAKIKRFNEIIAQGRMRLQELEGSTNNLGKSSLSLGTILSRLGLTISATYAAYKIIQFGKESFHAFQEAELSARKLNSALGAVGGTGKEFDKLIHQSKEIQKISIFSDEQIQAAQTLALQFGFTGEQVEKLLPIISDFASATGQDLNSAMEAVLRGVEGQGRGLRLYGIEIGKTGDRTKDLATITGQLTAKFKGQTEIVGKSSVGAVAQLANAWDDLKEKIGESLAGVLTPAFLGFKNLIEPIEDTTEKLREESTEITATILQITSLNEGNETRKKLLEELQTKYPDFLKNLNTEKITNEELKKRLEEVNEQYLQRIIISARETEIRAQAQKAGELANKMLSNESEVFRLLAQKKYLENYITNKKNALTIALDLKNAIDNETAGLRNGTIVTTDNAKAIRENSAISARLSGIINSNLILSEKFNIENEKTKLLLSDLTDLKKRFNFEEEKTGETISTTTELTKEQLEALKKLREEEEKRQKSLQDIITRSKELEEQERIRLQEQLKELKIAGDVTKLTAKERAARVQLEAETEKKIFDIRKEANEKVLKIEEEAWKQEKEIIKGRFEFENEQNTEQMNAFEKGREEVIKKVEERAKQGNKEALEFLKLIGESTKDIEKELANKARKQRIDAVKETTDAVIAEFEREAERRKELLEEEISQQDKNIDRQRELADKGLSNTLAFEERRKAELQKQQFEERKRIENLKLVETLLNAIALYSKDEKNPAIVIGKALAEVAAAKAATAIFAEEGGIIGTGGNELSQVLFTGKKHKSGNDVLVHAEKGEGILNVREMKNLGIDGFYNLRQMLKNPVNDDMIPGSSSLQLAGALLGEIQGLRTDIKNKRETIVDWNRLNEMIITEKASGLTKQVIKKRLK